MCRFSCRFAQLSHEFYCSRTNAHQTYLPHMSHSVFHVTGALLGWMQAPVCVRVCVCVCVYYCCSFYTYTEFIGECNTFCRKSLINLFTKYFTSVHLIIHNSSVFWVITRHEVLWNRRFGTIYICPIFKVPFPWAAWSLKMGLIVSPETLTSNHLTSRNNQEDGRI